MAKLVLSFIVIFCIIQLGYCGVPRAKRQSDNETAQNKEMPPKTDDTTFTKVFTRVNEHATTGLDIAKDVVESTLKRENLEKVGLAIRATGDDVILIAKRLLNPLNLS